MCRSSHQTTGRGTIKLDFMCTTVKLIIRGHRGGKGRLELYCDQVGPAVVPGVSIRRTLRRVTTDQQCHAGRMGGTSCVALPDSGVEISVDSDCRRSVDEQSHYFLILINDLCL